MFTYRFSFLIFFLLAFSILFGQSDLAKVHIDKPYYVSGEIMWYKIYLPEAFREGSGKARVIVKGSRNNVVSQSSVQLASAQIKGYYRVPFNLPSDIYNFSIYVLEKQSLRSERLLHFNIPIYNDLQDQSIAPIFPDQSNRPKEEINPEGNYKLNAQVEETQYNTRDEVSLYLGLVDNDGNEVPGEYSVAVIDSDLIGSSASDYCIFSTEIELESNVTVGLDERVFVQGSISNAVTNEPVQVNVIGAFNAVKNRMYYSKSTPDGQFTLLMPEQSDAQKLQITGYLFNEYDDTKVALYEGESFTGNITFTSEMDQDVANYLKISNGRKRIYQHFNLIEGGTEFSKIDMERHEVRPNKNYKISDYVSFESVGRFFDEITASQLKFYKENGKAKARMLNPEKNTYGSFDEDFYFPISPVFIVDGKMTKDADFIYNMRLGNVDEIDLYYDWRDVTEQYGIFGDFGYVVIRTNNAELAMPKSDQDDFVNFNALQLTPEYPVEVSGDDDSNIPQFRPTTYWNPSIKNKGKGIITFKASDDISNFKVIVVARAPNGAVYSRELFYSTVVDSQD